MEGVSKSDSKSNLIKNIVKKQTSKNFSYFDTEVLCKTLKISKEEYQYFAEFYEINILPRIQNKYMAYLISIVEDMIEEDIQKKKIISSEEDRGDQKIGRYKIILSEMMLSINKVICTYSFPSGAIITYNPELKDKEIRILIAHELGHLLLQFGIIPCKNTENYANLFTFLAINEKNRFYKSNSNEYFYRNEEEIINQIHALLPISQ